MKLLQYTLVLAGVFLLSIAPLIVPHDDPGTTYNESGAPTRVAVVNPARIVIAGSIKVLNNEVTLKTESARPNDIPLRESALPRYVLRARIELLCALLC